MKVLATAGAVLTLAAAGGAYAQAYEYTAEAQGSLGRTGAVEAAGVAWRCKADRCVTEGPWAEPGMAACQALAREVGPLASYGHPQRMFDAKEMAQCNAGAGVAADKGGASPPAMPSDSAVLAAPAQPARTAAPTPLQTSPAQPALWSGNWRTRRDCAECPELVWVEGGGFKLGAPEDSLPDTFTRAGTARSVTESVSYVRSRPRRDVFLRGFWMGRMEVTQAQWKACVDAGACRPPHGGEIPDGFAYPNAPATPVTLVTWQEVQQYLAWLSARTGRRYRLPSEAEWEYAAGSGVDAPRWWGALDDSCEYENVGDASLPGAVGGDHLACSDGHPFLAPVGSLQPNRFGLHDMLGNVAEFVADDWHESLRDTPGDGGAYRDPTLGGDRAFVVIRGYGQWGSSPHMVNLWTRGRAPFLFVPSSTGYGDVDAYLRRWAVSGRMPSVAPDPNGDDCHVREDLSGCSNAIGFRVVAE